jgi:hypothetical protein
MATKEQIAANRKNAKQSTGPKSPAGKDKARLNRLTHGLRAEQVVLPSEDSAEFQAFVDAWMADWKPRTMARAQLVKEAAVAAWRKERCVRAESTRLGRRIRETMAQRHAGAEGKVEKLVEALADDPYDAVKALESTRAGVERLIAMWEEIAEAAVTPGGWDDADDHHARVLQLCGYEPDDDDAADIHNDSWRLYLRNAPADKRDDDDPEPWTDAEAEAAAARLRDLAAQELGDLREALDDLPDETSSWLRQAEALALEPRNEDGLLLRYETQRSREFHRALGDLTRMAQSGSDLVAVEEDTSGPDEELPTEANSSEVVADKEIECGFSDQDSPGMASEASAAAVATVVAASPVVARAFPGGVARPKPARKRA